MKALVLSGGGAAGSVEVGGIKRLAQSGMDYDIVIGTSAGALNSIVLGRDQDLRVAAANLETWWREIKTPADAYRKKSIFSRLRSSFNDPAPFKAKIRQELSRIDPWIRQVRVATVNLIDGKVHYHKPTDRNFERMVAGSCGYIPQLPPEYISDSEWHGDGGYRDIAPLGHAIKLGADWIDVILASPKQIPTWSKPSKWLWNLGARVISILINEIYRNDVEKCDLVNRNVMLIEQLGGAPPDKKYIQLRIFDPLVSDWRRLFPAKPYVTGTDFYAEHIDRGIEYGFFMVDKALSG